MCPNFGWTQRDVTMPTGGKRQVTICHMNRNGLTLLAMGFTGKRAIGWKIKYIEAFNAMEAALSKPQQVYDDEPAPKTKRSPLPIDQMDNALDLVMTAEAALRSKEWLDADVIAAVSGTLGQALKLFAPARTALDRLA